jgi:hypothetical protein
LSARAKVTITRLPGGASAETAEALEGVVREVLADVATPVEVQFGTWPAEDGRLLFVCRVEEAPADPFGPELQWRWWSPLVEGPEALREALGVAVATRRQRAGEARAATAPPSSVASSF